MARFSSATGERSPNDTSTGITRNGFIRDSLAQQDDVLVCILKDNTNSFQLRWYASSDFTVAKSVLTFNHTEYSSTNAGINTNECRLMTTPKEEDAKTLRGINVLSDNILQRMFLNDYLESKGTYLRNILQRTIPKINAFVTTKYPKPAKLWFKFDFDIPPQDLRVGDKVFAINPKMKRMRHRYDTHRYFADPFEIVRIFRPVIAREPFRYLTTFSDKMTFTRDELVRARDCGNKSHQFQFD